jgi:ribonucleotide monophosphatase NagD (HAD superfamily)
LTQPITEEYRESFSATPVSTAAGVFYAYITKARSVHPIYVIGARGIHTWAARTGIEVANPTDTEADLPGVVRVTWNEYGQFNRWNPYVYEILYCVASDTRSGYDQPALR